MRYQLRQGEDEPAWSVRKELLANERESSKVGELPPVLSAMEEVNLITALARAKNSLLTKVIRWTFPLQTISFEGVLIGFG